MHRLYIRSVHGCMGPVAQARSLCRLHPETLYWTNLSEVPGLSMLLHVVRHCHVFQHCWVSHGVGVQMSEDLGHAGPLVLFESQLGGFFRGSWGRHPPGALLHHPGDPLCGLCTVLHPFPLHHPRQAYPLACRTRGIPHPQASYLAHKTDARRATCPQSLEGITQVVLQGLPEDWPESFMLKTLFKGSNHK